MRLQRQAALTLSSLDVLLGVVFLWSAARSAEARSAGTIWWNPKMFLVAAGALWLLAAVSLLARSGAATHPPLTAAALVLAGATAALYRSVPTVQGLLLFSLALLTAATLYPTRTALALAAAAVGLHGAAFFAVGRAQHVQYVLLFGAFIVAARIWLGREFAAWRRQSRLFDQARWAASQFANVNVRMQDSLDRTAGAARTRERLRIAREVHDTVGYALTAALVQIRAARKLLATDPASVASRLEHVEEMVGDSLQEVRQEVDHLRDESIVHRTGTSRWRRLCEGFADSTGIRVSARIPADLEQVSEAISEGVYRIIQESLTNAYRHGRADHVDVAMTWKRDSGRILLRVSDNGRGASLVNPGNGLSGMRERVAGLAGSLVWQSMLDRGFDVGVEIPWGGSESGQN